MQVLILSYFEKYSDGEYYQFFIKKDGIEKNIKIHSQNLPKILKDFAYWIYEMKKSLKLTQTGRKIEFKSNFPELIPPNSIIN